MFEIAVCDAYRGCKNPHLGALGIGVVAFEFLAFAAFTAIALEGSGQKFLGAGGFFAQMSPKLGEPAQCLVSLADSTGRYNKLAVSFSRRFVV